MSVVGEIGSSQLGHRLAQLREQAGLKQAEVASRVTLSQAVVSRIESGERAVSDEELQSVLAAIASPEAELLADVLRRSWTILQRPPLDHGDQELLWRAEQICVELAGLAAEPDIRPAFERRLRAYVDEILGLAELLLRRDHLIAFIGSIGIGKSTAICKATGLEIDGPDRPIPVLETGGGGITLCEVHLRVGPGFGIVVEPRSHDDVRADVADFADRLLGLDEPDDEEEALHSVPHEVSRAIRNMTGLTTKREKGPDGKTVRTDLAKARAQAIGNRRDLIVELLSLMELHRRDRRDEWFDPSLASNPLEWLRETFERINNGRHPEFGLPARIELVVPTLLDIDDLTISLVDTRGIDELAARADLEAHLEDPHTVSVLCSGFNDAPAQSVQHLIDRARQISNAQLDSHSAILVLARRDEALAVKDESGTRATSTEEGYELKGEQVANALAPYALSEMPVAFFNAFDDDAVQLVDFLADRVRATRQGFRQQLTDVLDNAQTVLDNAAEQQVLEVQLDAARHVRSWREGNAEPMDVPSHVQDSLLSEIQSAHAATVHAAIRREGEWHSLSYSHQLGHGARRLAVAALSAHIVGFRTVADTMGRSYPEAAELMAQAERLITAGYEDLLRKMQIAGVTLYKEQLQRDKDLWAQCEAEWGRGSGYRDRVSSHNREWFRGQPRIDLENELRAVLAREWIGLLQRVESIFDFEDQTSS